MNSLLKNFSPPTLVIENEGTSSIIHVFFNSIFFYLTESSKSSGHTTTKLQRYSSSERGHLIAFIFILKLKETSVNKILAYDMFAL